MAELDPRASFDDNLSHLLDSIDDPDVREVLEDATPDILALSDGSTKETRKPVYARLQGIIEDRLEDS